MSAATRQHLRNLRQLKRDDFVYIDQTSITISQPLRSP